MEVSRKSSCVLYRNFKPYFTKENNVSEITNVKYRLALYRFRIRNFNLPTIVMGRGRHPRPYNQRMCLFCSKLGDEFHFIFECEKTRQYRNIIPRFYTLNPSMYRFFELMNSTDRDVINRLGKFLFLAERSIM